MAVVKANQEEINKKLDLVLAFEKKVDLLLQIFNKKEEQGKNNNDSDTTASDKFLNPPAYQSTVDCTPPRSNDGPVMMLKASPGLHVVLASEVENVQFKRKKIGNVRLKEFTNSLGKQFKFNDLYDVDPLHSYGNDQFKSFNKWLAGVDDNLLSWGLVQGTYHGFWI